MGLGTALVDRARVVKKEAAGARVGGRTTLAPVSGQWFKARLFLPSAGAAPDSLDTQGGRRKMIKQPTLLFALRDVDREAVQVSAEFRLDVDSPELGRAVWEVRGDPEPLRKKRRVIGYYATLKRTDEPVRDTL